MASAIPLLFFASTPGVIYIFAIVFGIGLGGDSHHSLMAPNSLVLQSNGPFDEWVLTADGVAEALAPMLVGKLRDPPQTSYAIGFCVTDRSRADRGNSYSPAAEDIRRLQIADGR